MTDESLIAGSRKMVCGLRRKSRTAAARRPYPWIDGRLTCEVVDELATQMVQQHLRKNW
jgi:hypothetical protein